MFAYHTPSAYQQQAQAQAHYPRLVPRCSPFEDYDFALRRAQHEQEQEQLQRLRIRQQQQQRKAAALERQRQAQYQLFLRQRQLEEEQERRRLAAAAYVQERRMVEAQRRAQIQARLAEQERQKRMYLHNLVAQQEARRKERAEQMEWLQQHFSSLAQQAYYSADDSSESESEVEDDDMEQDNFQENVRIAPSSPFGLTFGGSNFAAPEFGLDNQKETTLQPSSHAPATASYTVPSHKVNEPNEQDINQAATIIQRAYRNKRVSKSLEKLANIASEFKQLQSNAPKINSSESIVVSKPILAYEEALTVLLTKIDRVASNGIQRIKTFRKTMVDAIEGELQEVDRFKEAASKLENPTMESTPPMSENAVPIDNNDQDGQDDQVVIDHHDISPKFEMETDVPESGKNDHVDQVVIDHHDISPKSTMETDVPESGKNDQEDQVVIDHHDISTKSTVETNVPEPESESKSEAESESDPDFEGWTLLDDPMHVDSNSSGSDQKDQKFENQQPGSTSPTRTTIEEIPDEPYLSSDCEST